MRPSVAALLARGAGDLGNAASSHSAGRAARRRLEDNRDAVASAAGVGRTAVVFTSGGTEANNLAIKGSFWRARMAGPSRRRLVIGGTEHPSVTRTATWLARRHEAELDLLAVDPAGRPDLTDLDRALATADDVALVSIMAANNETGVISPVAEIADRCRTAGVALHIDAVQAAAWFSLAEVASMAGLGDAGATQVSVSISGHKLGAPVGVGALIGIEPEAIEPLIHGGGQEGGARSGTSPVLLIEALAQAVSESDASASERRRHVAALRNQFVDAVCGAVPGATRHSPRGGGLGLPGHALISFDDVPADALLMMLDRGGIAASAGSACAAGLVRASPALLAAGVSPARARSAIRFTLGWSTTEDEIETAASAVPGLVAAVRSERRHPA